jgi:DNA polymerase-3 subunit gamma/tau
VATPVAPNIAPPAPGDGSPLHIGDWADLIERSDLRGPVGQLARHAALIGVDGSTLRLALKPDHDHFSAPPLVALMEERLGHALGRAVRVRFEKAVGGVETPADVAARSRTEQQARAERDMQDDPVVQALMRDMGGRIVPNSIRPPDE